MCSNDSNVDNYNSNVTIQSQCYAYVSYYALREFLFLSGDYQTLEQTKTSRFINIHTGLATQTQSLLMEWKNANICTRSRD